MPHSIGSITPPSHSIRHLGNDFFSLSMPAAVTFVSFNRSSVRLSQFVRWARPASLIRSLLYSRLEADD